MPGSLAPSSPSWRLALFYATFFGVIGVQLPFWPVWLQSRGLSADQIGLLIAAGMWVRALGNPLIASSVDRAGRSRQAIVALAWIGVASFSLFAAASGFAALLAVTLLFSATFSALLPIGETLAVRTAVTYGVAYGRIRLWGSFGFIVAAVVAGQFVDRLPVGSIFVIVLAVLALAALSTLLLPAVGDSGHARGSRPVREVLGDRRFLLFLVTVAAVQSSHAAYYGFATLHWRAAGIGATTIGVLWAEGVVAEIVLFAASAALLRRVDPIGLLVIGAAGGLVRWLVLAQTTSVPALFAVQGLHAATFGATHLGAVHFIVRELRPQLSVTAQALYAGVANGGCMGVAMLAAGAVYAQHGAGVWWVMQALCAVGLLGAVLLRRG